MKIICVVKFVPDVDSFGFDHETHKLIRENNRMMINPDDACAVGFALEMKKRNPEIFIEIVTMAPESAVPLVENILRVNADRGTVISDRLFAGSDTWATSRILSRYLSSVPYDCILTGTHAVDGDTSHVPPQVAEALNLPQISGIIRIDGDRFGKSVAVVDVEDETSVATYELDLPAVLGLTRDSGYRLPYVRHKNLTMDVTHRLQRISNKDLGFPDNETGQEGSLTRVSRTWVRQYEDRQQQVVCSDDGGVEVVYNFLKEKKFI